MACARSCRSRSVAILTGVLSICGMPGFSGFFSKDQVIYGALKHGHPWLYAVGIVTAGITAYYMFRLLFVTFLGTYRGDVDPSDSAFAIRSWPERPTRNGAHESHHHAPAWIMALPVGILIVPTDLCRLADVRRQRIAVDQVLQRDVRSGSRDRADDFRADDAAVSCSFSCWPDSGSRGCATRPRARRPMPSSGCGPNRCACRRCLTNAFYFDAALDLIFVRSAQLFGTLFSRVVDPHVIDGTVREVGVLGALARRADAIAANRSGARLRADPGVRSRVLHRLLRARRRYRTR